MPTNTDPTPTPAISQKEGEEDRLVLARLRTTLAPFDDEALAALANKGLVRRARKDLEATRPEILGSHQDRLRLGVGDATVEVAATPAQSTCTCPAGGVCRHILAALITIRESEAPAEAPAPADATPSAAEELLAVDDATLAKWAGKALVARASRALAFGLTAEIEEAGAVVVRFPTRNVTCRWMPGGGLAGMVCSCHAPDACEHRVAAVLAFQASRGMRNLMEGGPAALEASTDAPRTREEILDSVGGVLREMVVPGTSRLSRATADRLRTLAVSAHGVELPRLERLLRVLADEVALSLARAAQADSARLLAVAARVEALRHALARPTPRLIGEHRTSYELVGDLTLVGLGARLWRARSGYAGLTVYFWDPSARGWATWTDARPTTTGGFDPRARYHAAGPWTGLGSPAHASRNTLRLTGAWRNRHGRLSGRDSTHAFPLGPSDPAQVPAAVGRWSELVGRAAQLFGGGFRDRDERDALVLLTPAHWGPAQFDPIRQEVLRPIFDAEGRPLPLVLAHTPETQEAVTLLEAHDTSQTPSLLGSLRLDGDRLSVEPIALHDKKRFLNLTLDASTRTTSPTSARKDEVEVEPGDDPETEEEVACPSSTRLGQLLEAVARHLEALGEGGFASFRDLNEVRRLAAPVDALGLSACARALARVVVDLEQRRRGEEVDEGRAAHDLLRAYYLVRLAAAQESIAAATAPLG